MAMDAATQTVLQRMMTPVYMLYTSISPFDADASFANLRNTLEP